MQGFYPALQATFSATRLHAYHDGEAHPLNLDVAARYAHNLTVSMRLSPALHIFEVALRNNLHRAMAAEFGALDWYNEPGLLRALQQDQLATARRKLNAAGKTETPDRLVAELTLGFWVGLFSNAYEHPLWRAHPHLLKAVFPFAPRHSRTRDHLSGVLNPLRDLRNRVAHWERVAHLPNLAQLRQDVDRVVRWLCPAALCLLAQCDVFAGVLAPGEFARTRARVFGCFDFAELQTL